MIREQQRNICRKGEKKSEWERDKERGEKEIEEERERES